MFVRYAPEDGDAQEWEWIPGRVRAGEAEAIERRWGGSFDNFTNSVQAGSMKARRILLWHLLRKQHPTLRWEDTPDFYAEEVVVDHSVQELQKLRDRVERMHLSDEERESTLTAIDVQLTEAIASEELGKARSSSTESATG